jgi:hypothetical protein
MSSTKVCYDPSRATDSKEHDVQLQALRAHVDQARGRATGEVSQMQAAQMGYRSGKATYGTSAKASFLGHHQGAEQVAIAPATNEFPMVSIRQMYP